MHRLPVVLAVLAAVAGVAGAAPAQAAHTQLSIIEDDHQLLDSGPAARESALDEIRALGATTVHVLVHWSRLAPSPGSRKRPSVDLTDPAAYAGWGPFDEVVAGAKARGLGVLLTPTGPGPLWASQCVHEVARPGACKPRIADYAALVQALGVRYSGQYAIDGATLPRVSAWSLWNEPNHKSSLMPQSVRRNGETIYVGARRYRELASAGLAALGRSGHGSDLRLLGETAPVGGSRATAPLDFYRALFCLDRRLEPFHGTAARRRGCIPRPRFDVSGVAHHPYTSGAIAVPAFRGSRGDVPIAGLQRLVSLLDRAARDRMIRVHAPIYVTEFGYQSRPPDPFGVTLAQQAQYINYADYIAFRNRRIASVAQYELRDDRDSRGFNTGLRFADGRAKPALNAYALPIYVTEAGPGHVSVFGLARAAATLPASVAIQSRRTGHGAFRTVARVTTNRAGYFLTRIRASGRYWRLLLGANGRSRVSRIAIAE